MAKHPSLVNGGRGSSYERAPRPAADSGELAKFRRHLLELRASCSSAMLELPLVVTQLGDAAGALAHLEMRMAVVAADLSAAFRVICRCPAIGVAPQCPIHTETVPVVPS